MSIIKGTSIVKAKTCTDCGILKPLSEFPRNKPMKDGYLNQCKECVIERRKRVPKPVKVLSVPKSVFPDEPIENLPPVLVPIEINLDSKIYYSVGLLAKIRGCSVNEVIKEELSSSVSSLIKEIIDSL